MARSPPDPSSREAGLCSPDNKYVRREKIGKGSFKNVYKAYNEEEGLEVAWNEVFLSSRNDASHRDKIKHEVSLLSQLHHPNIISIYDAWEDTARNAIVFITELMTSGTLREFIGNQRGGIVRYRIIRNFCMQIVEGLAYLHSKNIIHRYACFSPSLTHCCTKTSAIRLVPNVQGCAKKKPGFLTRVFFFCF